MLNYTLSPHGFIILMSKTLPQELNSRSSVACGQVILIYEVLFCLRKPRKRKAFLLRNLKCPHLDSTALPLFLLANLAVVKVASC